MTFSPVTPELTKLICECQVQHGQKTGAFSRISPDLLDQFSQSFYRMKALNVQMMDLYLIFQSVKGRCHGNLMSQNCYQRQLIQLAFVALVLENELQYHGLAVRINSANDFSISCENFMKFGPVTP